MMPAMQMPTNGMMNPMMSMPMNPMMSMPMNPMMNPMMMNGMMGMAMPMTMCQMSCEMTPDGMVCTMKPMDGMSMDMMKDCCERMNAAMSMGMPAMMMCSNMPMMMCMPAKK